MQCLIHDFFPVWLSLKYWTASPASAVWVLRLYSRSNIVIACPQADMLEIIRRLHTILNFPLSRSQNGGFLSIIKQYQFFPRFQKGNSDKIIQLTAAVLSHIALTATP